ncbi:hypothetical protein PRUPE_3G216300 [Prunus persica]|uniref:Uncharacterized protein n=1 Tax=Prunus persica TaxID=3760 RepID=A0A251Q3N7_PRUPE|nr:uncharacterized protein LOC109948184 [Prunus persica]ONI18441.1 hypothetical protein PRUPE_3G216300 [Prunus persica]
MDVKCAGAVSQLGLGDLRSGPSGLALNRVDWLEKVNKWVCFNGLLGSPVLWTIRYVEDKKPSMPANDMQVEFYSEGLIYLVAEVADQMEHNDSKTLHMDLSCFPRPFNCI